MRTKQVMRRVLLLEVSLVAVCVLGGTAWAEGSQVKLPIGRLLSPLGAEFSERIFAEGEAFRKPEGQLIRPWMLLSLGRQALTVKTSYIEKREEPKELKGLLTGGKKRGFINFLVTSSLLDGKLSGEGELAYSPLDPEMAEGFGGDRHRLLRFGFKGAWGGFGYGAEVRSVGKGFAYLTSSKVTSDQEGGQVWGERRFGPVGVKVSLLEFWDNVEKDPSRPQITKTRGKVTADVAIPSWPRLSLSYLRGSSESSREPEESEPDKSWLETVEASLHYSRPTWEAGLSSTYSLTSDRAQAGRETAVLYHALTASYHPTNSLTITPNLNLREEGYRWSRVQIKNPSASLSFTYSPLIDIVSFTGVGSYTRTMSSDGSKDSKTVEATAGLVWALSKSAVGKKSLSFEVGYKRSLDAIHPNSSHEELFGKLLLKIGSW